MKYIESEIVELKSILEDDMKTEVETFKAERRVVKNANKQHLHNG